MVNTASKEAELDQNLRTQLQYDARKKSVGAAYVLWFCLGYVGAHRFYLGHVNSGLVQFALFALGWMPGFAGWFVLAIWWLVDAFLIPGQAERRNLAMLERLEAGLPIAA